MSYTYNVYSYIPMYHEMEGVLETPVKEVISTIFFLIGLLGAAANCFVLYIFVYHYTVWRLMTRVWVNISLNMLCGSLFLMFRSLGDQIEILSNTEAMCRLRFLVPISLDICALALLAIMLLDRITVIHFQSIYIYNDKSDSTKLAYGWSFGLCFFMFKSFILDQTGIPNRCSTPVSLAYPLEMVSMFTYAGVVCLMMITFQGYVFTPNVNTSVQKTWVKLEAAETISALIFSVIITSLWAPKHILQLMYITYGWQEFEYQIWMTIFHIPARLSTFAPLLVLMRNYNFWLCAVSLVQFSAELQAVTDKITEEETKVDVIVHSVLRAMYPNHPEFTKEPLYKLYVRGQTASTLTNTSTIDVVNIKRVVPTSAVKFEEDEAESSQATKIDKVSWDKDGSCISPKHS